MRPLLFLAAVTACAQYRTWTVAGGANNIRYSALDQINTKNVGQLQVAWTFDSGDAFRDSEMEANPVVVDGVLYTTTPKLRVIALDAATGALKWAFDPKPGQAKFRNRGVTVHNGRVYFAARQWLYSLDARTGQPDPAFGENGRIDLRAGLGRPVETLSVSASSPGVVYRDLLILGSIVAESLPAAPGDIRAYDLKTGKLRWIFHTIPHPGEFGYETWPKDAWQYIGGANAWAGLSLDEKRGIVFAPTGSAAFDFYGQNRHGDNLFANSLLALDAATGKRIWHFQFVRHDVWDRDLPAPPSLITLQRGGRTVDALAQITKSGHIFLFERATGKPLEPIEEFPAPPSEVPGEKLARSQPLPVRPPPFTRQVYTEDLASNDEIRERLKSLRFGAQFTPPSFAGTVVFPGFDGGGEWGGGSWDPETGYFYVNANDMPWLARMVKSPPPAERMDARGAYAKYCASCHRADLAGAPPEFPALKNLQRSAAEIAGVIRGGAGRMPAFANIPEAAAAALANFLLTGENPRVEIPREKLPIDQDYTFDGYKKFVDADGFPGVKPPWGTLTCYDLGANRILWQIPFGEIPKAMEKGLGVTGSENYGGGIVTAGGLLFIGATNFDKKFRAFDKRTGKVLWETVLPAAGNATPAMYEVNGKQYVVIGAGGGKWGNPSGGSYVAFRLP